MPLVMVPNLSKFDEQMKSGNLQARIDNINSMVKILKSNPYSFYANYGAHKTLFNDCMKRFGDIGIDKKEEPKVVAAAQKAFKDATLSKYYHDLNVKK